MRGRYNKSYIEEQFNRIDQKLESSVEVYLIGGGSMAFRELKDTTKDIDLVVDGSEKMKILKAALHDTGYYEADSPSEQYEKLGAQVIMENGDGCRFDIFNREVASKFVLTKSMKDRSEILKDLGFLKVNIVSKEDMFLFKSVAGRDDDISDMQTLVQAGVNHEEVLHELYSQVEFLNSEFLVTKVEEGLIDLEESHNITTSIDDEVAEISARVHDELAIVNEREEEWLSQEKVLEELEIEEERFQRLLEDLEEKSKIRRQQGEFKVLDDTP